MQDGDSNKGKDEAKRETIGQAHLIPKTKSTYLHWQQQVIIHVYSQEQKQERNAERQPNIIVTRAHLFSSTLDGLVPHTHIYTKTQRNKSGDFPLRAPSPSPATATPSSSGVVGELVLRAGTCWPLDTTDGVWGTNRVSGATSAWMEGGNC